MHIRRLPTLGSAVSKAATTQAVGTRSSWLHFLHPHPSVRVNFPSLVLS